jgi:hypothetical protein
MQLPDSSPVRQRQRPWLSLWIVALISLLAQLWLCQFFSFGKIVPLSIDVNPSNLWKLGYHFPPTGSFQVLNWLGVAFLPQPLTPLGLAAAHLPNWWFFTTYAPVMATLALLAMAAFLRELGLARPAALFGGVIFAWQGDIIPFVYPGHYAYITSWPFFAIAAWGALRAQRTGHWAYALISGTCCGTLVGLPSNTDRGGIDSLLIAALYLAPLFMRHVSGAVRPYLPTLRLFSLCVATAFLIALAPLLSLFQSYIVGVKMSGGASREQTYKLVTQFSIGPAETLTYLVPGFFGWHMNSSDAPYWGWIGEWPDYPKTREGSHNLNLAITTTGTIATVLALIGAFALLPGRFLGPGEISDRQRFFGRLLLVLGFVALILAWGWHTGWLYRALFQLPLMDKWRNPLKWLEITTFAVVTLSAFGLQHLLGSLVADSPKVKSLRRRLAWFALGILILLGLGLLASYPLAIVLAAKLQTESFESTEIANAMNTMHTSLLGALFLVGLGCMVLLALWHRGPLRKWTIPNPWLDRLWQRMLSPDHLPLTLALGLALLATAQLGWVDTKFIEPMPLDTLTETNPLLEALRGEGDRVRVSVAVNDWILNTLLQNQFAAMDISSLDVSAASRIPDDLNAFFQTLDGDRERMWFLTGVKHVAIPQEGLPQLQQDPAIAANISHADGYTIGQPTSPDLPTHALVTMKDYMTKATFVPGLQIYATDAEIKHSLVDPAWNPRAMILVSKPATISVPPALGPAAASDALDLKTYTPTEIDIDAQTSKSGFILINDQYDPDWQLQINGHDEPVIRADYLLRAVAVPAGQSKITMSYVAHYHVGPWRLPATIMNNLSDGAMIAAWLVAGFVLWRRNPKTN